MEFIGYFFFIVCSFFIIDDNVREREELMNVTIVTSDPSVHIIRGTTVIKIADYEDGKNLYSIIIITIIISNEEKV